jgi:hypothetical protein
MLYLNLSKFMIALINNYLFLYYYINIYSHKFTIIIYYLLRISMDSKLRFSCVHIVLDRMGNILLHYCKLDPAIDPQASLHPL